MTSETVKAFRERKILRRMRECRHFRGFLVGGRPDAPCKLGLAQSPGCVDGERYCERFEGRTRTEVEAEERRFDEIAERVEKASEAVNRALRERIKSPIACPICGTGRLAFRAASNGHVAAVCSTTGCVSWIE